MCPMKMKKLLNNKLIRHLLPSVILGASILSVVEAQAQDVTVTASLDADTVMMGKYVKYTYKISNPLNVNGFVELADSFPMEMDLITDIAHTQTDNSGTSLSGYFSLQPSNPGEYTLPPILFITENDTIYSPKNTLIVDAPDVSELNSLNKINDAEDVVDLPEKWYDSLPDFVTDVVNDYWLWILIGAIIIIGGICAYLIYSKRLKIPFLQKKIEPPYDVAMRELASLKERHLWEQGQEKEYFTILTDILRKYIEGRFRINAMEMTSSQLLEAINSNSETYEFSDKIERILRLADYVKFAKNRPSADENIQSYNGVYNFVVETKPLEENSEDNDDINEKQKSKKKKKSK